MLQSRIVGELFLITIPPPIVPPLPGSDTPLPPVIVKPSRIAAEDSPLVILTTELFAPVPSMIVVSAPDTPTSWRSFPKKLIVSKYVPAATSIRSPDSAPMIAV